MSNNILDRWPGWPMDPNINIYPYILDHLTTIMNLFSIPRGGVFL